MQYVVHISLLIHHCYSIAIHVLQLSSAHKKDTNVIYMLFGVRNGDHRDCIHNCIVSYVPLAK